MYELKNFEDQIYGQEYCCLGPLEGTSYPIEKVSIEFNL